MHEIENEPNLSPYKQFQMMYELQTAQLVLLERIYDMLTGLLTVEDEELANAVYGVHENGQVNGPEIYIADPETSQNSNESSTD